ncbi:hypothetical protein Tco_0960298 [Tanacetum coccineum]
MPLLKLYSSTALLRGATWYHLAATWQQWPPFDLTVDRCSGGSRRWSAAVDRRWPPLTAAVDWWSGGGSGDDAETMITPRGTTQVVTRGILLIRVRGNVHRIAGTMFLEGYVACSHRWI